MPITQWQNHNRYRGYPFIEDSILQGVSGGDTLLLTNDTFIDLSAITYLSDAALTKLTSVTVDGAGTSVTFGFTVGVVSLGIIVSAASTFPLEAEVFQSSGTGFREVNIKVVFGAGVTAITDDVANHGKTFVTNLTFEPSTTASHGDHLVTLVEVENKPFSGPNDVLAPYTGGSMVLREGYNMSLVFVPATNTVRIDAVRGAGLGEPCEQIFPATPDCEEGIYYINGLHPDWFGRFIFEGGTGMTVTPDKAANKLVVKSVIRSNSARCKDPE